MTTIEQIQREIRREQMHDRITLAIIFVFLSSIIAGAVAAIFFVLL